MYFGHDHVNSFVAPYKGIDFGYGIKATDDIAILPFAGPYFSYGIGGRLKGKYEGVKFDESSFNYVNHPDMGRKGGCGAE